jgi:hypothetical protein
MSLATSEANETLASLLTRRARSTSDGGLALAAATGLLAIVAIFLWRPRGWVAFLCLATCIAAFGVFGIADRESVSPLDTESPTAPRTWRVIRSGAMVTGVFAGLGFFLACLTVVLGTWIS